MSFRNSDARELDACIRIECLKVCLRAEGELEWLKRGHRVVVGQTVVIPGDCKDQRCIFLEGLIELVLVEPFFSEVIDDVAQVKEECRTPLCGCLFQILHHEVHNIRFVGN